MTKKNRAAQALGRLGGRAGTPAQNLARKRNARHAGRPRRVCSTCGEPVVGGHVNRKLDTTCGHHGWVWRQSKKPMPQPRPLSAPDALDAIARVLRDMRLVTTSAQTLDTVASIVRDSGRRV